MASLGACLAAVRAATLAELAEATGVPISNGRLALRRLDDRLEAAGMKVLDDGSHVQLTPEKRSTAPSPTWSSRSSCPGHPGAAEALAIVIMHVYLWRRFDPA